MRDTVFSAQLLQRIDAIRAQFPSEHPRSSLLMSLRAIQQERGCIDQDSVASLAAYLGVAVVHIEELLSCYGLLYRSPVARICIKVCTSLPCVLRGAEDVCKHLELQLGLRRGEVSADQQWALAETECQAACTQAPVVLVNDSYTVAVDHVQAVSDLLQLLRWPTE